MKKKSPIGKPIGTERARELAGLRRTFGAGSGRPRTKLHCFCGAMTLSRALKRSHDCEEPTHKRKDNHQ